MFEKLQSIDAALLLFFNHLNNPVLDFIFYWLSNKWIWIPFYAFLGWFLYKRYPHRLLSVLFFIGIMITLSDQISSALIKNSVMRLRPCHDPLIGSEVHIVKGYCGGMYGFVSSHAANVFALTTFLIYFFRRRHQRLQTVLLVWASAVSFSRIYLGVHYPGDIIGGALLGSLIGMATAKTYRYYDIHFASVKKRPPHQHHHRNT
ncbi:MAG TPA: phosphatase PAP2 family protein [Bacteroidia bacterium]|nr:phosphatase PAP2 family protein [Bacteroidia bacterium]